MCVNTCRWCFSTKRNQSSSVPFTYSATKWPSFDNKIKLEKEILQHYLRRIYSPNVSASLFFQRPRCLDALCLLMMAAVLFARRKKRNKCAAGEHKQIAEWTKFFEAMLLDRESLQTTSDSMCVCVWILCSIRISYVYIFFFFLSFCSPRSMWMCVLTCEFRAFTESIQCVMCTFIEVQKLHTFAFHEVKEWKARWRRPV